MDEYLRAEEDFVFDDTNVVRFFTAQLDNWTPKEGSVSEGQLPSSAQNDAIADRGFAEIWTRSSTGPAQLPAPTKDDANEEQLEAEVSVRRTARLPIRTYGGMNDKHSQRRVEDVTN